MTPSLLLLALLSVDLPQPERSPGVPTAEQRKRIREGVVLHDAGDYAGAIAKYRAVLDEELGNVTAMHELAYSYFARKNFAEALDVALMGAGYRSALLPHFYVMIGNSLDELGRRDEAIGTYKAAIERSPGVGLLHFNLGLSLLRSSKWAEARPVLERSVMLQPNHPSSHYVLGSVYLRLGYRIPAVLALSRFLLLEPPSQRSRDTAATLTAQLGAGVTPGTKANQINITLSPAPIALKDEGDFDAVDLALSLSVAAGQMEKRKKTTACDKLARLYGVMGDVLSRTKAEGFASSYYAPFFAQLAKLGYERAFVARAFESIAVDGCQRWATGNSARVREFDDWQKGYVWPAN